MKNRRRKKFSPYFKFFFVIFPRRLIFANHQIRNFLRGFNFANCTFRNISRGHNFANFGQIHLKTRNLIHTKINPLKVIHTTIRIILQAK